MAQLHSSPCCVHAYLGLGVGGYVGGGVGEDDRRCVCVCRLLPARLVRVSLVLISAFFESVVESDREGVGSVHIFAFLLGRVEGL